ncbi:MAG: hypothetical protein WBG81_06840 [Rhodanobacter sp.]|jgi:hypothetical protein|uniref:hypothetical protein n=1 Tax=Rhodanobacter sp. KK11 TaxID=3083255 RepID=UPI00296772C8|nr:hypothetical protein [Rhodanobacter sp. KK11]MDW2983206.1 hypothetical protein [Rhodanobacter sp. KK11]
MRGELFVKDMVELQGLDRAQRKKVGKLLFWLALGHWLTWVGVVTMAVLIAVVYQASHYNILALAVASLILGIGCNKLAIFVLRRKYSDDLHRLCSQYAPK